MANLTVKLEEHHNAFCRKHLTEVRPSLLPTDTITEMHGQHIATSVCKAPECTVAPAFRVNTQDERVVSLGTTSSASTTDGAQQNAGDETANADPVSLSGDATPGGEGQL